MKVSIVGLGLIGGSLAIDLRATGFASQILGVEKNEEHCLAAKNRGLCDQILELDQAVAQAQLLIFAIPVDAILSLLPRILPQLPNGCVVTDMGSTKFSICQSVKGLSKRPHYVASHPMAGTEHSGPAAALRGLFQDRTTVICEAEESAPDSLRCVDAMYDALGMRKVYMSAKEHDLHAAYISHLSHISSFVLANTVLDKEKDVAAIFNLAGGGFESTVRLAKSSPEMWNPIFNQNRQAILHALEAYLQHLCEFRDALKDADVDKSLHLMRSANAIRRVLRNIGQKTLTQKGSK